MLHQDTIYPLATAYGFVSGSAFIFITLGREVTIEGVNEVIIALLPECNGYKSLDQIVRDVAATNLMDNQTVHEVMDLLISYQIAVDARQFYKLFHDISSNPMPYWRSFGQDDLLAMLKRPSPLINNSSGEISNFENILIRRRSTREFSGKNLTQEEITRLCWATYGQVEQIADEDEGFVGRGTVPSAGGLYPLTLFVIVPSDMADICNGVYQARSVGLSFLNLVDEHRLWDAIPVDPEVITGAALVLILSCNFQQVTRKYSNRGYRYALLEAGHAAQNAYCWCSDHDLGVFEFGGFSDEKLAKLLKLPYPEEAPLISLIVGKVMA